VSERLDFGVTFDVFQKRFKNYALKSFKRIEDIVILITNLSDPKADFEAQNNPDDLSITEQANPMIIEQ